MHRFDRIALTLIAVLSLALLGLALWAARPQNAPTVAERLGYLVADAEGGTQVWQLEWDTGQTRQLAHLPGSVLHYAVAPRGIRTADAAIVYPVERTDGGHDLWIVNTKRAQGQLWLVCAPDDCVDVAWSPDGEGAAYTRITTGAPSLWWIDNATKETQPLVGSTPLQGRYAAWSPDGLRLAYVDPAGQVCVVSLASGETLCIPAGMDAPPVWSPDGESLLVTDMRLGTGFVSHILQVDVTSGVFVDLSDDFNVEDDAPAWSPDGEWIAFRRQAAGAAMGKQVWLMRADGSNAHTLTPDYKHYYGPPIWSVDGKMLLAARYSAEGAEGIWSIAVATDTIQQVIPKGYLPHRLSD